MNGYNLSEWLEGFEKDGREFDFATDALISNTNVLLPGRFYILNYMAETSDIVQTEKKSRITVM